MGFFAVSKLGAEASYDIEACHLSFWVIPRPWYRLFGFDFSVDIGLRIKSEHPLRRLRIVVPFDSQESSIVDLSAAVLDQKFNSLIFGRQVKVKDDVIEYDGPLSGDDPIRDRVIPISAKSSVPHPPTGTDRTGYSVWSVELAKSISTGEGAYVRFRITAQKPWRVWSSKGWGLAKRGVVLDFRISDVRESILLGHGQSEAEHILPIKQLFLFLVAPMYFVPIHFSPILHYTRLLEPKVWEKYLEFSSSHVDGAKLSIHQWRYTNGHPISVDNPYRAYMDLSREFGREVFLYYLLAVIFAPAITHLVEKCGAYFWKLFSRWV